MRADATSATFSGARLYWLASALFLSIAVTGYLPPVILGQPLDASLLIAPIGASALLMLAAPNSSYSRPWVVLMANTMAALIGLAVPHLITSPIFASATALALVMTISGGLRCIHPPSGGLALLAVSLGPQPLTQSLAFLVDKVMLSTAILIGITTLLNGSAGWLRARTNRHHATKVRHSNACHS